MVIYTRTSVAAATWTKIMDLTSPASITKIFNESLNAGRIKFSATAPTLSTDGIPLAAGANTSYDDYVHSNSDMNVLWAYTAVGPSVFTTEAINRKS